MAKRLTHRIDAAMAAVAAIYFAGVAGFWIIKPLPIPNYLMAAITGTLSAWSSVVAWKTWRSPTDLWRARALLFSLIAICLAWTDMAKVLPWFGLACVVLLQVRRNSDLRDLLRRGVETLWVAHAFFSVAYIALFTLLSGDGDAEIWLIRLIAISAAAILFLILWGVHKNWMWARNVGAALFGVTATSFFGLAEIVSEITKTPKAPGALNYFMTAVTFLCAFAAYQVVIIQNEKSLGPLTRPLRPLIRSLRAT